MKALKLSGSLREGVGKKDAKKLRREGNVPCVMYGGENQIQFSIPEKSFKPLVFSPDTHLIDLDVDGKSYRCILQDIQYHPVNDSILHADFLEIFEDKPVTVALPLRYTGTSKGILKGGRLFRKYRKLTVSALPGDLPDEIVVDITKLGINDSIKISDLERPNLSFLDPPNSVAVAIKSARAIEEEEVELEEEGAEGAAEEGGEAADKEAKSEE
jgi:large subunit ribosomal protein L25